MPLLLALSRSLRWKTDVGRSQEKVGLGAGAGEGLGDHALVGRHANQGNTTLHAMAKLSEARLREGVAGLIELCLGEMNERRVGAVGSVRVWISLRVLTFQTDARLQLHLRWRT